MEAHVPRPKYKMPKYRRHISGQAVVDFNSTSFYLGPFNSSESYARYLELVEEYQASGLKTPQRKRRQIDEPLKVSTFIVAFLRRGLSRVTTSRERQDLYCRLAELLGDRFGESPLHAFGPLKLSEIRDEFIKRGNSRRYINDLINMIQKIFNWGVSLHIVGRKFTAVVSLFYERVGRYSLR